jgi:signal transduction histidine kinase
MLAGMGMLALAPILGVILAWRTTAPLSQMVKTAERLRPGRQMERLPNRDSGDELDRLAEAFNRLLDRMADYLRQKHDFLNNAAHELRTPLAAIRSTVEVQLDRADLGDDQREVLTQVIEETNALHHLVSQLLTLASTDVDRIASHAEPVDLSGVVRDAVEMFRAVAEVSEITLTCDIAQQCIVEGNRHSLRQVLNNLLDNAIKFTAIMPLDSHSQRPHQVVVRLVVDSASEVAILTVADTGIGVAAEDLGRLGERFYRVDKARQRSTGVGGTGLGLSICQAIVNAHRGQWQIDSKLGTGTTVTITLPFMPVMRTNPRLAAANR